MCESLLEVDITPVCIFTADAGQPDDDGDEGKELRIGQ